MIGDENGIVAIPKDSVEALIRQLGNKAATETAYKAAVRRGEFSNVWVDRILDDAGCEYIK